MQDLVETYRRTGLGGLIGTPTFRHRLSESSPVFATIANLAAEVRQAGAVGVAIFLPVNPIFRDAAATAGFETLHVDDAYIRALATKTTAIYEAAGFATFNRLDALPASGFIDLVHVNAEGMEAFSREISASLVETMRHAPADDRSGRAAHDERPSAAL
jgi:lysophospholipase L1-like esterase